MAQQPQQLEQKLPQGDHHVAAPAPAAAAPAMEVQRQQKEQIEQRVRTPAPVAAEAPPKQEIKPRPVAAPPAAVEAAPPPRKPVHVDTPPAAVATPAPIREQNPTGRLPIGTTTEQHPTKPVTTPVEPVTGQTGRPTGRPVAPITGQPNPENGIHQGHHPGTIPGQYGQFAPIVPFRPQGNHWGWQDPDAYRRGWDPRFFEQFDPNCQNWRPSINQEADTVSDILNSGDTRTGAGALNRDLWAMRGDIYAQNELLNEVKQEVTGAGASLYLGNWDSIRGTWDNIEVVSPEPPPGYQADPSYFLRTFE